MKFPEKQAKYGPIFACFEAIEMVYEKVLDNTRVK